MWTWFNTLSVFLAPGTQNFMVHLSVKTVGPVVHLVARSAAVAAFTLQFQRTESVCQVR